MYTRILQQAAKSPRFDSWGIPTGANQVHMYIYIYLYIYTFKYVYIHIYIYGAFLPVKTYVNMYIYIYTYIHMFMYTYIHTYIWGIATEANQVHMCVYISIYI